MITDYLADSPRTKKDIAERSHLPIREVELLIQAARLEGAPILSSSEGYWLSRDPEEIRKCAERLRERAITQLETARALYKAADRTPLVLWTDAA